MQFLKVLEKTLRIMFEYKAIDQPLCKFIQCIKNLFVYSKLLCLLKPELTESLVIIIKFRQIICQYSLFVMSCNLHTGLNENWPVIKIKINRFPLNCCDSVNLERITLIRHRKCVKKLDKNN